MRSDALILDDFIPLEHSFFQDMYRFGFRMGLPVFLYDSPDTSKDPSKNAVYGSNAFKTITKLKSRLVRDIVAKGYDVTWTDTDILWFHDPIPLLRALKSDFVVQSNAPFPEEAESNGPLRINSGFYRVRATTVTLAALNEIVSHASASDSTEQPSFYMVLCGGENGDRVYKDKMCLYQSSKLVAQLAAAKSELTPTILPPVEVPPATLVTPREGHSMLVEFLNRTQFPNGNVNGLWDKPLPMHDADLYILHNNWIRSIRAKVERLLKQKMWFYDKEQLICRYEERPVFPMEFAFDAAFDGED